MTARLRPDTSSTPPASRSAHVRGLTREELPNYIMHLLRLAGTEIQLFAPAAMESLFVATGGLPRKVNLLALHAFAAAAIARAKTVTEEHVQAALGEVS